MSEGDNYYIPIGNEADYEFFDESLPSEDQIDYITSTGKSIAFEVFYSTPPKVFEQIVSVPQVAHDRDTYATSNISP